MKVIIAIGVFMLLAAIAGGICMSAIIGIHILAMIIRLSSKNNKKE